MLPFGCNVKMSCYRNFSQLAQAKMMIALGVCFSVCVLFVCWYFSFCVCCARWLVCSFCFAPSFGLNDQINVARAIMNSLASINRRNIPLTPKAPIN